MNSQITLPAAELKQALPGLSKVVSRKSSLPVLQAVRITRSQAGQVSLSATDLDTFVSYNVEQSQPGKPLDVVLPFEQLTKSVKGSTGDVIIIPESKEKVRLRYQVGDSPLEQSVSVLDTKEFPPSPKITQGPVKMPANFGETLRQAFETSSQDGSRYVLQGAYLDVSEPKCHCIVSTNGRTLFAANTFNFDLKESVNISKQKFLSWSGFLDGECGLAVQTNKESGGWVQLSTPRWNCIVKQIDGVFPNWRQVVPEDSEKWTKVRLSEAALAQILTLSTKLPGNDDINHTIQLRVNKQDLYLEGKGKDDKEFTSASITGVTITGKSITTALNREYLQTALRCGLDEIRINSEMEPLLFCRTGKRMVIMPVRLTGPAPTSPEPAPLPKPEPTKAQESKPAEERNNMPRTSTKTEATKPAETSPTLIDQVELIKDTLKNVIRDLSNLVDAVKLADKEKRASEKEVESVRSTLKKLQQVTI